MMKNNGQQRRLSRTTTVVYPAALLTSFALGLTNLGIVFFARDIYHASPAELGWLAATWSITYTISCLFLRPLFGHLPANYLITASSALMGGCILLMQFAPTLFSVFVLFAVYGVCMSMFWPPLMAWLSHGHEGRSLTRRFARYNIMWSIGSIVSPYVCGVLAEISVRYPLLAGTGMFVATALYCMIAAGLVKPEPTTTASEERKQAQAKATADQPETLLRYPAWIGLFAAFFGMGVMLAVFPVAAVRDLGITKSMVGLLLLVRALCGTLGFFVVGRTVFWHFRIMPMVLIQLAGALFFGLLCFSHTTLEIGTLFGLLGLVLAFTYSISIFHSVSGCANRIKRTSIHESTLSAGLICGSAAGGMIYEATSMSIVYAACAAILTGGAVVQLMVNRLLNKRVVG